MTVRRFVVVRWSPDDDGPMGSEHIGRVCEIIGERDGRVWVRLPDGQAVYDLDLVQNIGDTPTAALRNNQVLNIGELPFGVGDEVRLTDGRRAEIVDCVWHYAKRQPMYFLGLGRKLSSRRYSADELTAAE